MPQSQEVKRIFTSGRMNLTTDDRLVQSGEYRYAQNIGISTTDGSDVGAIENIRGNSEISPGDLGILDSSVFIGSFADTENDRVYGLFVSSLTEGIYELDLETNVISRILEFSRSRNIFNFHTDNFITGINIVNGELVWSDGRNPTRKVDVERFRDAGAFFQPSADRDSRGQFVYTTVDIRSRLLKGILVSAGATSDVVLLPEVSTDSTPAFETVSILLNGTQISNTSDYTITYTIVNGIYNATIQYPSSLAVDDSVEIVVEYTSIRASERSTSPTQPNARLLSGINPEYDRNGVPLVDFQSDFYSSSNRATSAPTQRSTFPANLIGLGRPGPSSAPRICSIRNTENDIVVKPTPGFNLEDKFIYASYRWVFRDGQESPLSAFSKPIFFPRNYVNPEREPADITSFQNSITAADIMYDAGSEEVTEIKIYVTEGLGRPVREISSIIKKGGMDDGSDIPSSTPYQRSIQRFRYDNNRTYRDLPEDQINYIFSDIPINAKTQEFVGNRLVLANYERNRPFTNASGQEIVPSFNVDIDTERSRTRTSTDLMAVETLKSDRQVEVGLVYVDDEGRRTPVIVSKRNSAQIPFDRHNTLTRLSLTVDHAAPTWARYVIPYYKDTLGDYETILPIECIRDSFNRRVYVRIHPSEVNKIRPTTTMVVKATSGGVVTDRKLFRVAPYGQDGFVQAEDTTTNFFVPFDVAQGNTNNGFAAVQTARNLVQNIPAVGDTEGARRGPYTLTAVPEGAEDVVVNSVFVNGLQDFTFQFSPADNTISLAAGPQAGSQIRVTFSYRDPNIAAEEANDLYFALTPVDDGSIDLFPEYNGSQPVGDNSVIFETIDESLTALESALYYEWGQSFRCVNGSHTNSEDLVVNNTDEVQQLYQSLAVGRVSQTAGDVVSFTVNQLSNDVASDTLYSATLTDSEGNVRRLNRVSYNRTNATSGTVSLLESIPVEANEIIEITEFIPEGRTVGDASSSVTLPLSYFNCYAYSFGVEEYKIRGQFNANALSPGIRASAVNTDYRSIDSRNTLIHSGIVNDTTGVNRIGEFNRFNTIDWELEDVDGSIQHLHERDTNLVVFQEDKVKNVPINKNLIQDAAGNLSITRSPNFFNTERAYNGEYGIGLNPESFSTYGNRMYFADKNAGALLRLANDGITEISQRGLESFVREEISDAEMIVSSYDFNRDQLHWTFRNRPEQPSGASNNNELVLSLKSCPDPRAECNIVQDPLGNRSLPETFGTQRVYTTQETVTATGPLFGLSVGDSIFSDRRRVHSFDGNYRWFLLIHEATTNPAFPANNIAIQISPFGVVTGIEESCNINRPPDLARELFAISQETFDSAEAACANGVVEGYAYHDGDMSEPENGDTIYAERSSILPLEINGFKLITEGIEKFVLEIQNGLVVNKFDCDVISQGRTAILGSHPVFIPFGLSVARRNQILCEAPFAEELYWFDAETELPELGDFLYENDHTSDLAFGPWVSTRMYVPLAGRGPFVSFDSGTDEEPDVRTYEYISPEATTTLAPNVDTDNWREVFGYVMYTFSNGYYTAVGTDGRIITYGNCSEVLCFDNPNDLFTQSTTNNRNFTYLGVPATYSLSAQGVETTRSETLLPVRNAEINYFFVIDDVRYPTTGTYSINAENQPGVYSFSRILDQANITETGSDDPIVLSPNEVVTLPVPVGSPTPGVNDLVQITSLCYRGITDNNIGDPLDRANEPPTAEITFNPANGTQQVSMNITAMATAMDLESDISSWTWTLPSGVTQVGTDPLTGTTPDVGNITFTSTTAGDYTITLAVTDGNTLTTTVTQVVTFYDGTNVPPEITGFTVSPSASVETNQNITIGATATDSDGMVASWAWTLPSNVTLVSGSLTGTGTTVGNIEVTSNVEDTHTISLQVTDNGSPAQSVTRTTDITFTAAAAPGEDPFDSAVAYITNVPVPANMVPQVCGGAGSGTTATNAVYYNPMLSPRRYFNNPALTEVWNFDSTTMAPSTTMVPGLYGVSDLNPTTVPESEGGGVITRIENITTNGTVMDVISFDCDIPYRFSLGYTDVNTSPARQAACQMPMSTEVYADQPRENFSSADMNPVTRLFRRTASNQFVAASNGFYTDGTVVRQWDGSTLSANLTQGCSFARTATILTGTLPTGTNVIRTPEVNMTARDVGELGDNYSVTVTLRPDSGREFTGTPTYTVTGPGAPTGTQTGSTYTLSGTFGDSITHTVTFSATTQARAATSADASFTVSETIDNASITYSTPTGVTRSGNTLTDSGLAATDGWNLQATLTFDSGFELVPGTLRFNGLSNIPARTGTNEAGTVSFSGNTLTFSGNMPSPPVDQNASITLSGSTRRASTTGTATLTATTNIPNTSVSLSGGTVTGNSVSSSGRATPAPAETFALRAEVVADPGWVLSTVNQTNPTLFSGSYTAAAQTGSVMFTGTTTRPSFQGYGGDTAVAACEETTASTFFSDTGDLLTATVLYNSANLTQNSPAVFVRTDANTVRHWTGTAFAAQNIPCAGVVPTFQSVSLSSVSSTSAGACALGENTNLFSDAIAIASMTTLRTSSTETNADGSSNLAPSGFYRQGGFFRMWNQSTATWGAVGSCNTRTISPRTRFVTTAITSQTFTGTITVGGSAATLTMRTDYTSGQTVTADPAADLDCTLTLSNGAILQVDRDPTSLSGSQWTLPFSRSLGEDDSVTLQPGTYTFTLRVDNDLIPPGGDFASSQRREAGATLTLR